MFNLLSANAKQKVLKLNENYNRLTENTKANQQEINKLNSYIKDRLKTKENYKALQIKHTKSLENLEKEHKLYQAELKKVIEQQESLSKILSDLKIVKQQELKKAQEEKGDIINKYKQQMYRNQKYAKDLDLDVKKIGSSTDGVHNSKIQRCKNYGSFKII